MKRTIGQYLSQPSRKFPLDCQTMDGIESAITMTQILGNLAGDKIIVMGCQPQGGGAQRAPGYLFLKTKAFPEGEIIYFEGGPVASGMYVKETAIPVNARDEEFPRAYVERSMAAGIGTEQYRWEDFEQLTTLSQAAAHIERLDRRIDDIAPELIGKVEMWAGQIGRIPEGYHLCDGSSLPTADYPKLFQALGYIHGGEGNSFKLPDLRGKFITGYDKDKSDYNAIAKDGGRAEVELSVEHLPEHTHDYTDDYYAAGKFPDIEDGFPRRKPLGAQGSSGSGTGSGGVFYTSKTGGGVAHENRPPYYVLAYIIRIK